MRKTCVYFRLDGINLKTLIEMRCSEGFRAVDISVRKHPPQPQQQQQQSSAASSIVASPASAATPTSATGTATATMAAGAAAAAPTWRPCGVPSGGSGSRGSTALSPSSSSRVAASAGFDESRGEFSSGERWARCVCCTRSSRGRREREGWGGGVDAFFFTMLL